MCAAHAAEAPAPRGLPANIEAEQALLGAILVNNEALNRVAPFLKSEHFSEAVHGRIFTAISKLIERNQTANPVTLKTLFDQDGALQEIGGAQYLARLAASVVTIINAADYGHTILDLHLRRQLIAAAEDMADAAYTADLASSAQQQIETAQERLYALETSTEQERGPVHFKVAFAEAEAAAEAAYKGGGDVGIATGLADLDVLIGGLHPSDLAIVAGRPSMGKTALASTIAGHAAERGDPVLLFSLEMSRDQNAMRMAAGAAGVSAADIRRGRVSREEIARFLEAGHRLSGRPSVIDDTAALTVAAMATRARRIKQRAGLGLVIVDYLQLMRGSARSDNRVQEVSEISRGLKALAKDLDVPVLALSQLSRAVEGREDKRPMLSDLRESGAIEQDADVVIFLYRREYYLARSEPQQRADEDQTKFNDRHERWQHEIEASRNLAELIVAKNRHGPVDSVVARFDHATMRFSDLAPADSFGFGR